MGEDERGATARAGVPLADNARSSCTLQLPSAVLGDREVRRAAPGMVVSPGGFTSVNEEFLSELERKSKAELARMAADLGLPVCSDFTRRALLDLVSEHLARTTCAGRSADMALLCVWLEADPWDTVTWRILADACDDVGQAAEALH